jgi:DnaJ-class molecular chaperone
MHEYKLEEKNYYQRLFVDRTATKQEIVEAYRQLARILHPDSDALEPNDESITAEYDNMFKLITEAYNVLTNEKERAKYDKSLPPDLRGWDPPGGGNPDEKMARKFEERKKAGFGSTAGETTVHIGVDLNALRQKMMKQMEEQAREAKEENKPVPRTRRPTFWKKMFEE